MSDSGKNYGLKFHFKFSLLDFWSWCLFQAAGSVHILRVCVYTCVFGCCGGLSRTSICHGTIARSSKRSAAVMCVEGALLLLADVVFGHVPIPVQTMGCWGTAGGLPDCLSQFPPPPPHPYTTCTAAHKFTAVQLSCLTGSEVKKAWMLEHPVTLPIWGEHTHTNSTQAKHRLQQTMEQMLTTIHFSHFKALTHQADHRSMVNVGPSVSIRRPSL